MPGKTTAGRFSRAFFAQKKPLPRKAEPRRSLLAGDRLRAESPASRLLPVPTDSGSAPGNSKTAATRAEEQLPPQADQRGRGHRKQPRQGFTGFIKNLGTQGRRRLDGTNYQPDARPIQCAEQSQLLSPVGFRRRDGRGDVHFAEGRRDGSSEDKSSFKQRLSSASWARVSASGVQSRSKRFASTTQPPPSAR